MNTRLSEACQTDVRSARCATRRWRGLVRPLADPYPTYDEMKSFLDAELERNYTEFFGKAP